MEPRIDSKIVSLRVKPSDLACLLCCRELVTQLSFTYSKLIIKITRKWCEICSKLTIKTPERRYWHRSGVFIVTFEHISKPGSSVFIVNSEHAIAGCVEI